MGSKLYVGNLSANVGDSDLQKLFSAHGTILSAKVIMDRVTNQSKGFGFVEMSTEIEAQAAITALNGKDHGGQAIKVNEAKSKDKAVEAVSAPMEGVANAPW